MLNDSKVAQSTNVFEHISVKNANNIYSCSSKTPQHFLHLLYHQNISEIYELISHLFCIYLVQSFMCTKASLKGFIYAPVNNMYCHCNKLFVFVAGK